MSKLYWTTEKPTGPGQYWIRKARRMRFPSMDIREGEVFVVEVAGGFVHFPGDDRDELIADITGEWAGPIEPPD